MIKITLEKHWSYDRPTPYYYIYAGNLAIYSCASLEEAEERLLLIEELGVKEYIERIKINKEVIKEIELDTPADISEQDS